MITINIFNLFLLFILGLFQKAIMQSGCAFNPWVLNENHRVAAFKLANNLGCFSNDPEEVVKYLRNVPVINLVKETKFKVCIKLSFVLRFNEFLHRYLCERRKIL